MELRKKTFKFRVKKMGDHIHVTVYSGIEGTTFVNCGMLIFHPEEWQNLEQLLTISHEIKKVLITDVKIEEDR